jgi:low temperature requirement protein LtrA
VKSRRQIDLDVAAVAETDTDRQAETGTSDRRASWLELFFDLVFALAVAQLDSGFRGHPSLASAAVMVGLVGRPSRSRSSI